MSGPNPNRDRDDRGAARTDASPPGTPLWVKLFGLGALVLILIVAVLLLVGGGQHGPGRHGASAGNGPQNVAATRAPSLAGGALAVG